MSRRRIAVLLEISEISSEILPVVRRLFPADQAELTLITVAQRNLSPMVTEAYLTGMPPSLYASPIYTEDEWDVHVHGLQDTLHRIAQNLRSNGYTVQTVLLKGEKVQAVAEYVENRPFDLIAMATYGRKGLSRLVYGSVAERLLRMVTVPMLLLRHQPTTEGEPSAVERVPAPATTQPAFAVVAATDGGAHSRTVVLLASRIARALDADYRILITADDRKGTTADQQIMRTVADAVRGVEPQPALVPLVGSPDVTIARYLAGQPADLLVFAAFRNQQVQTGELDRTVQRVIEGAPRSVLVVKEETNIAHMLVCVTDHSTPLLDDALQFAVALKAKLEVVYVAPSKNGSGAHWLDTNAPDFAAHLEADRILAGAWQRIQSRLNDRGIAAEKLHLGYGDPVSAVLQLAQHQPYDLLVTGAPGPGQPYAGSFVSNLVSRAPQSVLVMRA